MASRPGGKPIAEFNDVCSRENFSGWEREGRRGGGGAEKFVNRACEVFLTRLNNV